MRIKNWVALIFSILGFVICIIAGRNSIPFKPITPNDLTFKEYTFNNFEYSFECKKAKCIDEHTRLISTSNEPYDFAVGVNPNGVENLKKGDVVGTHVLLHEKAPKRYSDMFDLTVNGIQIIEPYENIKAYNNNYLIAGRGVCIVFLLLSLFLLYVSISGKEFIYEFNFLANGRLDPSIKRINETPTRKYLKTGLFFITIDTFSVIIIRFFIQPYVGKENLISFFVYIFFFLLSGIVSWLWLKKNSN